MPGIADLIAGKGGEAAEPASEKPDLIEAKPAEKEDLGVEEAQDGQKHIPIAALTSTRAKKREAEERASKLEGELKAANARAQLISELYGKLPDPEAQLREDAEIGMALWEHRDSPEVKAVLALIQKNKGAVKVSERAEKPVEAKADPMLEELVRERTKDVLEKIYDEYGVRPQLRGVVSEYVMSQKGLKPSRDAVLAAVREYATAQEWTKEFIRGDGKKPKPAVLPNPGGLNAGVSKKTENAAPEKPKSLGQFQEQQRNKLRSLMEQRMPS